MQNHSNKLGLRLIASYLPQFHPIPENDLWWGRGFTEWTNVGKAKPLFKGHEQPRVPADLGYYDLRLPEVRVEQAKMAEKYGIEGFCYWHYWFGNGKRILQGIFNEVLESGAPDFPFCLGWANETWSGIWHGVKDKILLEQTYPGPQDYENHFYEVLKAFKDSRYIKVDNKPLFMVYKPDLIPDPASFIKLWRQLAEDNGLEGLYFVAQTIDYRNKEDLISKGFDAVNVVRLYDCRNKQQSLVKKIFRKLSGGLNKFDYKVASRYFSGPEDSELDCIPTMIPNWDHSPRSGRRAYILTNSTPELFKEHVKTVVKSVKLKPQQHRIIFIKSWNEWGEGNYLEPDIKDGINYLKALKEGCNTEL
ncbi:glycosyltransferase WbsX family protein [Pedobacter panaciterrae]